MWTCPRLHVIHVVEGHEATTTSNAVGLQVLAIGIRARSLDQRRGGVDADKLVSRRAQVAGQAPLAAARVQDAGLSSGANELKAVGPIG